MGFVFISLFIINAIAGLISCTESTSWRERGKLFIWLGPIFSSVLLLIAGIVVWNSYSNYVGLRAFYDATIEQHAAAVEIYADKAVIDVGSAAWTDLKYKGYQDNIASFVKNLQYEIVMYNKDLISKKKYGKNWFFSWLIVMPDADMKIISMRCAKDHEVLQE